MTLNQVHVDFWTAHQPQPKWISQLKQQQAARDSRHDIRAFGMIDSCVNAHAGNPERKIDKHFTSHNLLAILQMRRKRSPILPLLLEIAHTPGTSIQPGKRAAFARKWAARIKRDSYVVVLS